MLMHRPGSPRVAPADQVTAAALDTLASNVSAHLPQSLSQPSWRARRHNLRQVAGSVLGGRTRRCGRSAVLSVIDVLRSTAGHHHFSGLETCGSVWSCPVCAVKITEKRREEVRAVLDAHMRDGGKAAMVTLTVPHTKFQSAGELLDAVRGSWRKVKQGRAWLAGREGFGWQGDVRVLEVTNGANGWHPHLHVLVLFDGLVPDEILSEFGGWLFGRWRSAVARSGFGTCSEDAYTFELLWDAEGVSKYVQKWGAAEELTKSHIKAAKGDSRTPFQILADIEAHGRNKDKRLFRDFATAFKGARQLTWSGRAQELRRQVTRDQTDEQIAAADPEVADLDEARVLSFERPVWQEVAARGLQGAVLDAVDRGGATAALAVLERANVPHEVHDQVTKYGEVVPKVVAPAWYWSAWEASEGAVGHVRVMTGEEAPEGPPTASKGAPRRGPRSYWQMMKRAARNRRAEGLSWHEQGSMTDE